MSNSDSSPAPAAGARQRTAGGANPALYRVFWRWHFYAGLLAIPVITVLCLSGIIWLFSPQITSLAYDTHVDPPPRAEPLTYAEQVAAVQRRYPGATPYQLGTPRTPERATMVNVNTADGRDLTAWVDPYRGVITDVRDNRHALTALGLELHGSLLTARFLGSDVYGDRVIEIVAGWTIVLLITGLYLFWPRRDRRGLRQAFTLRKGKAQGSGRTWWRDLHAVTGATFSLITLFFLVTGMAWTGVWGAKFGEVTTKWGASYPDGMFDGAASTTVDELQRTGKGGWLSINLPTFPSGIPARGADRAAAGERQVVAWEPGTPAPLDAIVSRAQSAGFPAGTAITFPEDETGSYGAFTGPDWEPKQATSSGDTRTAYIDQYTAQVLRDFRYADYGIAAKANDFGIAVHEGREWGVLNQILMLLGTLAILLSCATSIVMWRRRKPKGLGAPRRTGFASRRQAAVIVLIAAALGAFYPLLGATMLVVLALDLMLIRFTPLRRAFG